MFLLIYCIMEGELFCPMNEKTFLGLQFPTLSYANCMSLPLAAHSQMEVVRVFWKKVWGKDGHCPWAVSM